MFFNAQIKSDSFNAQMFEVGEMIKMIQNSSSSVLDLDEIAEDTKEPSLNSFWEQFFKGDGEYVREELLFGFLGLTAHFQNLSMSEIEQKLMELIELNDWSPERFKVLFQRMIETLGLF
jgi:hypothetical protein